MLREDYDRFISAFSAQPPAHLKLCDVDTVENYYLPIAKVVDTRTELVETELQGSKIGVYVDVFPLDAVPDDKTEREDFFKELQKIRTILTIKNAVHIPGWPEWKQRLLPLIKLALLPCGKQKMIRKLHGLQKKYSCCGKTQQVGSLAFTSVHTIYPRSCFNSTVPMPFEGYTLAAPAGWQQILTDCYGDYMRLPPEEARVPRHVFEAWWKE